MRHLKGMAVLAGEYEGFIVDLWGVVHDGVRPYPGSVDCLARLQAAGRRVVLLSNAPRTAAVVQVMLRGMGIGDDLYNGVMTSGEYCRALLAGGQDPQFGGNGRRLFHIGGRKDVNVFEGLDYTVVTDPAEADFVLNTGPTPEEGEDSVEPYVARMEASARAGLPMLCANPDIEVIRDGRRIICAGLLASYYAQMGGAVRLIGKPHPEVYEPVFEQLGLPRSRVIAVGDALATDMRGAKATGIAGAWVLGGIHQEMIGNDAALAEAEARSAGLAPEAVVPSFAW
ncbi:hydrolase IIA [Ameyamaea chiangmaiensis NBRC 103196]|uniref:TIGR01459 family HAD-type hydrolase n=1 Tax=Ameyamaea chiangmaiensis TaxID=442969 RepID=A0A850PHG1_9PROT|nr:TIGR01459 family HAD-type hydrolase [Ameyamaea chiangmaiensis]MBS4075730.1 TIGR01459 family HAD-type hydrolase [Ameyamaea chiangmaiensis]NVN41850.1 TIGR01459 family HAD-type hydrolase [Ameyamaea chiangmaiensis]GBQ70360.1 hydrolase IIA [Ameyamaea chiangmaiensis NBRC 103196]